MNLNLLIGILLFIPAIVLIIIWYVLGFKKLHFKEQCTSKTMGTVVSYSNVVYNDIRLPVVEFDVDGNKYSVVGPKFKGSVFYTLPSFMNKSGRGFETNLTTRDNLPDIIKLTFYCKNIENYFCGDYISPLIDLYPIDSEVEVYYNPANPKMAYVQRYVNLNYIIYILILITGIVILLLSVFFIFFQPLHL